MPRKDGRETINQNGADLEERTQKYLESVGLPFIRSKNNGIDFIISDIIHLDCVSTGTSGSIDDKLPKKCHQYINKYNLKDIFILHPYSPITKGIAACLRDMEHWMRCRIHVLDWEQFEQLVRNEYDYTTRKAYSIARNGVRYTHPNIAVRNEFFDFNNAYSFNNA